MDELLYARLAPRRKDARAESPWKAFDSGKTDSLYFASFAIENADAAALHNVYHFIDLARFLFMIAEHSDDGHALRRFADIFHQQTCFVRQAVIDDVAAEEQYVGTVGNLTKRGAKFSICASAIMQVGNGCYADGTFDHRLTLSNAYATNSRRHFREPTQTGSRFKLNWKDAVKLVLTAVSASTEGSGWQQKGFAASPTRGSSGAELRGVEFKRSYAPC